MKVLSYIRCTFSTKMMDRKLYPLGIQTFERIRKENMFYVDKTDYVYRMAHTDGRFFFLNRPRRFGKSLLVSTFKSYFEGRKELFEGLAMERLEQKWEEYPVLLFSLAGGKHLERKQLEDYLLYVIGENEKNYGIQCDAQEPNIRLLNLIGKVHELTGRKVVLLIDEYDAPLLDVVHVDESLDELRYVMRNFYSPLKDCEPMLHFVFMTGITKFSQLSIFSELNNICNVSMDAAYAGICGITKDELLDQMGEETNRLAQHLKWNRDDVVNHLKMHYDGYHFCWPSPDVFNPFSLLHCLAEGKFNSYWFGSGTPTYLINMMRKFGVKPSQLTGIRAKASSFDAATETMSSLTPLLYQSGYLTIKGYDDETQVYSLDIPNQEIFVGLYESLLPGYLENSTDEGKVVIADISSLLKKGKAEDALQLLADFLETVPYCDHTNYEGHYQQMLYVMFALLTGYRIQVEQHTAKGRMDLTIETESTIYVMELKFGKTPQEALLQIDSHRYADAFRLTGKRIVKVGLNIAAKHDARRLEWLIG